MDTAVASAPERPALRGVLHAIAIAGAIAGTTCLLLIADSPSGYVGAAIFGASLIALYTTSATYHTITWRPLVRSVLKRLDHAVIFVLIAGTYTPFSLKLGLDWGVPLLAVVWSLAAAGALLKIAWPDAPRWFSVSLYVGLGWVGVVGASEVFAEYAASPIALVLAGGALYTLGGIFYALRRPDPWPRLFGYHEVFHTLVVAGSAIHFAAIAIYVL